MEYEVKNGEVFEKTVQYNKVDLDGLREQLEKKQAEKQRFVDSFDEEISALQDEISAVESLTL
jgi:peptidoglycan hydrolase CwlO-like protein